MHNLFELLFSLETISVNDSGSTFCRMRAYDAEMNVDVIRQPDLK